MRYQTPKKSTVKSFIQHSPMVLPEDITLLTSNMEPIPTYFDERDPLDSGRKPMKMGKKSPAMIDIEAPLVPLVLNFQTRSSKILALQNHIPSEVEEVKESESIEKPQKILHVVIKPIIQEVREIITPSRKVTHL